MSRKRDEYFLLNQFALQNLPFTIPNYMKKLVTLRNVVLTTEYEIQCGTHECSMCSQIKSYHCIISLGEFLHNTAQYSMTESGSFCAAVYLLTPVPPETCQTTQTSSELQLKNQYFWKKLKYSLQLQISVFQNAEICLWSDH